MLQWLHGAIKYGIPVVAITYLVFVTVWTGFDSFSATPAYLRRFGGSRVFEYVPYSRECPITRKNNKTTHHIPHADQHEIWLRKGISNEGNFVTNLTVLHAYVFDDYIAVTSTSRDHFGRRTYCMYYDCHGGEILSPFESVVFPESTVYCARRLGADYISLVHDLDEEVPLPVPIVDRTMPEPEHLLTVCLPPLYGDEPKWIQIVDFIEHHKLQGVTHFFVYISEVDAYSRALLDDYVRTGDVELITLQHRYGTPSWQWQMVEIFDCLQRSRQFSKWTAFIDIDERLTTTNYSGTVAEYLETITDPTVANLEWHQQWVKKTEDTPPKFINTTQLLQELVFLKYNITSSVAPHGYSQKCIVRPELIGAMGVHKPQVLYNGAKSMEMLPENGVVRQYRNMKFRLFGETWSYMLQFGPELVTRLEPAFEKRLIKNIVKRTTDVYELAPFDCRTQFVEKAWKVVGMKDPCSNETNWRTNNPLTTNVTH